MPHRTYLVPRLAICLSCVFSCFFVAMPGLLHGQSQLPDPKPEALGVSSERLARIDDVVNQAIRRGDCPGAVVLVAHQGHVVYRKAFGLRSKQPAETPMTVDTVFDLASLTKPVATATSIMLLVEQGKLSVTDRVARHLPTFAANGKERITVEQLLLHTSGLLADNPVDDYRDGRAKSLERIYQLRPPVSYTHLTLPTN